MVGLKELVWQINHEENFERAQGMLSMLNLIYDSDFGILNRRVVRYEDPFGSPAEKYGHCHDVYSEL